MRRTASLALLAGGILFASPARAGDPSFVQGSFVVIIGGQSAWVERVEGGDVVPEVVEEATDFFVKKHLGNLKYEDFTLTLGLGMNDALDEWIRESFAGKYARKDGSIVALDMDFKAVAVREFYDALITEIGFPASDGAAKDPAHLTITFRPATVKERPPTAADVKAVASTPKPSPRPLTSVLCVDAIPCSRLLRAAAITVHLPPPPPPVEAAPEKARISNLAFTVSEADAPDWMRWYEDFVIGGQNDDSQEKTGSLHYLTPSLRETMFTIDFHGLGIFKATADAAPSDNDKNHTVTVELYVEQVTVPLQCRKCQ